MNRVAVEEVENCDGVDRVEHRCPRVEQKFAVAIFVRLRAKPYNVSVQDVTEEIV